MKRLLKFGRLAAVVGVVFAIQACAGPEDLDDVATDDSAVRVADLDVTLSLDQVAYAAHEPVLATVTVRNRGKNPAKVLSWMLPAADLEEPLFRLARTDAEAPFVGAHYKRPPAAANDFVHLAAGQSLTRTVDLSRFYDLSVTGDYKIRVEVDARVSNTVPAWIEGRATPQPEPVTVDLAGDDLSFSGRCNSDQQGAITQAVVSAAGYTENAKQYLAGSVHGPRYTTWFGAFNQTRWDRVAANFVAIDNAFDTAPITVDCKCKKPYYAYVYPTQPYVIYVCKAFWSAPATGTDSKAGTLIHEMSHFNATAGTDDHVYGQSGCKSLAMSDPAAAIDNADSHEYFAENTPPQQ